MSQPRPPSPPSSPPPSSSLPRPLSYRDAGVDIDAGERLVERIGGLASHTLRPEVLAGIGGFASVCRLPPGLAEPLLVAGTDGVGTKLKVAFAARRHGTVGIDLVAMCVNDVLCTGAEPLFFLDYFGCGRLEVEVAEQVIAGIAEGCRQAGCALLGGETAELPGFYADGEYDLAGFALGVVDRARLLDGSRIEAGDVLLGLASSGLHSNGYSLARQVLFSRLRLGLDDRPARLGGITVADELLRPTRIYVRALAALRATCEVRGLAHITGGGLLENPPRMLPAGSRLGMRISLAAVPRPAVFQLIAEGGPVEEQEMRRTFNLGVGLLAAIPRHQVEAALAATAAAGEQAFVVGEIVATGADSGVAAGEVELCA